jgi:Asp-tRNA(Asn)/Glu-tRNA(Gln) amidotransferase A subunit family amidase
MMDAMVSALAQAAAVRDGSVTATELVEAALEAIECRADLNAFVTLCTERALAEAAQVRPGDARPLCGVPVGIKDLMAPTEGVRTTHGSAAFGDWVPDHDAPHVARLRAAGAIVVGKTNTPELGLRPVTEPLRWGPTRNPRDTRLSPGGSSGGSAAAVAAGLVPLCDGSDFGGSIRIPAACCGVVGYKPSAGLVPGEPELDALEGPRVGVFGAIAQSVPDVAAALEVMAARDFDATPAPAGVPVRVALAAGRLARRARAAGRGPTRRRSARRPRPRRARGGSGLGRRRLRAGVGTGGRGSDGAPGRRAGAVERSL